MLQIHTVVLQMHSLPVQVLHMDSMCTIIKRDCLDTLERARAPTSGQFPWLSPPFLGKACSSSGSLGVTADASQQQWQQQTMQRGAGHVVLDLN